MRSDITNTFFNPDGKMYTVVDATDEDGVYAVTLEANRSARS